MSGWIKIEKDLETDPRTTRMAKRLAAIYGLQSRDGCNAYALPGVTLVVGALTRLWIYADSHIRSDNTIDAGAAELDELLGIPGFCSIMPEDWLVEQSPQCVELPGFLDHNGVEAIKKAQTQKRVENHRRREREAACNASALPDQTRLDQTKTKKKGAPKLQLVEGLSATAWERWTTYRIEIRKPLRPASLEAARRSLAKFGAQQIEVVEQSIAQGWTGLFPIKTNGKDRPARNDDAAWAEAKAAAGEIGFRKPWPQESPSVYMTQVTLARDRAPPRSIAAVIAPLASALRAAK